MYPKTPLFAPISAFYTEARASPHRPFPFILHINEGKGYQNGKREKACNLQRSCQGNGLQKFHSGLRFSKKARPPS